MCFCGYLWLFYSCVACFCCVCFRYFKKEIGWKEHLQNACFVDRSLVISLSVCFCLFISMPELHQIFYACGLWPWLTPALVALQKVMYF